MEKGYEFLVDSREKKDIIKAIVKKKNIKHRVTALAAGDFVLRKLSKPVESIVGIERKAIPDLVQSIQSQRLFNQCAKLKRNYKICYLMISGDLNSYLAKMHEMKLKVNINVIYGTIASVSVRGEIQVMWFPNDSTLVDVAYRICEKVSEGKYGMGIDSRPKYLMFSPKRVLMSVPGVSSKIADKLLGRFGSLKTIANTELPKLTAVDGVGDKMAEKIYSLFNKESK